MSSQAGPKRNSLTTKHGPSTAVKKLTLPTDNAAAINGSKPSSPPPPPPANSIVSGVRTVKKLRLSTALTIPEGTTVSDACWRMAASRVDAVLSTDSNALL
ncbi:hypothetical protein L484_021923 [Morus notabilis]|uniref:Uncharacterized protein n=1 Tax=Morus notabilis TaxID=981085 RepID=W9S417_9ROSA|nr:CBS domain-containing protein CBSCBSPB3 [Morus notabilis]EXC25052.1 hypothetical protein L484_021923 [Morus notabilis]